MLNDACQVGFVVTVIFAAFSSVWLPMETSAVLSNVTDTMLCTGQNHMNLVVQSALAEFTNTIKRNSRMLTNDVATWHSTAHYASNSQPTAYTNSLPAIMLGVLFADTDAATLWTILNSGEAVVSAEWVNSSVVVGRMYNRDTTACWEAPYSSSTGYGTWAQTTTGPLGV